MIVELNEHPGYGIDDQGNVYTRHVRGSKNRRMTTQWRKIRQGTNLQGYPTVQLYYAAGKSVCFPVHRLMLEAFVGPRPPKMECRHLNGNRKDNRRVNLAWGTRSENMADRGRNNEHGDMKGEKNGRAKITWADVNQIRKLAKKGLPRKELAKRYKLTVPAIGYIVRKDTWKD